MAVPSSGTDCVKPFSLMARRLRHHCSVLFRSPFCVRFCDGLLLLAFALEAFSKRIFYQFFVILCSKRPSSHAM